MKKCNKSGWLPMAVLALGVAALVLRRALYAVAVDEKGLLVSGHPLEILLWIAVFGGTALIAAAVRKLDGSNVYEDNFRPSNLSAVAHFLMGYSILMMVLLDGPAVSGTVGSLWTVLGCVTAPGFVWAGFSRMRGKKPFFLIHAGACLFLLLHIVSHYQSWSGNPQLQDYVFDLLAAAALMLFSYYTALFEADAGKRRMQLVTGLLAVLLCGAGLSGTEFSGLYVSGALWALTDLCSLTPKPKESEAADEPA